MLASILSDFGRVCCLFEVYRPRCERRSRLLDLRDAPFGTLENPWEVPDLRDGPRSGATANENERQRTTTSDNSPSIACRKGTVW